jgi:hypothetical protein
LPYLLIPNCWASVAYYTKKRQDDANELSTGIENKGLAKEEKMKMLPFYAEGDRGGWQKKSHVALRTAPTKR